MKQKYPLRARNETGDTTIDIQEFVVPDSAITSGSGVVSIAAATGDVTGPASATDNAITRFNGTTGKTVQNSAAFVDDNGNVYAPNVAPGLVSVVSSGTPIALVVASKGTQVITGSTAQTITLPVVTTLPQIGFAYRIINDSTQSITVNSSGGNLVQTITTGNRADIVCTLLTGTSAASWAAISFAGGGVTNSAGANVVTKSDGTNLVASLITDDGTDQTISPPAGGSVVLQQAATPTDDILKILDSGANKFFSISADGSVTIANQGFDPLFRVTDLNGRQFDLDVANGRFVIGNLLQFGWINPGTLAIDATFVRHAAGVIRSTTDGASTISSLIGGGAAVASATVLPVPTGRVFHVTGTTDITSITSTNFVSGAVITLIFDDILTFTDGNNLKLAGNFTTAANSTISLIFDGTNWFETSRSVNA